MMSKLTPERLREWTSLHTTCDQWDDSPLLPMHGRELQEFADAWAADRREVERLRAERDRLREALEEIAEHNDAGRHDGLPEPCPVHDAETMFAIAREALAATEEKRDD